MRACFEKFKTRFKLIALETYNHFIYLLVITALSIEVSAGEVLASFFKASSFNTTDLCHYYLSSGVAWAILLRMQLLVCVSMTPFLNFSAIFKTCFNKRFVAEMSGL